MIRHLYTLVFAIGLVVLSPVFAFRAARHRKYLGSLRERLGDVDVAASDRPTLWIHAVSVGETLAIERLLRSAVAELADWRVVLSTTTATGQSLARERFPELDVFYFPLDLPFAVERALDRVRPSAVCLVETEIWPNFLSACSRRGISVSVVNGRLSDRSFRGYRRAGGLLAPFLQHVRLFLMQSRADADRVAALGARSDRIEVVGNLKYDVESDELVERLARRRSDVAAAFALPDPRRLVVAGSSVAGEETILAEALHAIRLVEGLETTRMLVAPRHPERFADAERAFRDAGLEVSRRTIPGRPDEADILLLDSLGELASAYVFADVVFVGGSLVPRGGHNIIEPALFARAIVVGPFTENFRQIVTDFVEADAVVQLDASSSTALAEALTRLLQDPDEATRRGQRARGVLATNRGATERTLTALRRILDEIVDERPPAAAKAGR